MAQLDCNVKSCCHNEDNCCCLSSIEVNGSNAATVKTPAAEVISRTSPGGSSVPSSCT